MDNKDADNDECKVMTMGYGSKKNKCITWGHGLMQKIKDSH